jgi:hypothetical protein
MLTLSEEGAGSAEQVTRADRAVNGFWLPLLGAVTVIALAWGVWAVLIRSADEQGDPETASDSEAEADPGGGELGPTDVDDPDDRADGDPSTADGAGTETGPDLASDGPILGSDVGYDLLVGTFERPALVDLDSGRVRYTDGDRLDPIAVSGSWLVAHSPSPSPSPLALNAFPLDDLEADPAPLLYDEPQLAVMDVMIQAEAQPGRLWVRALRRGDVADLVLQLADLASGSTVDHPLAVDPSSYMNVPGSMFPDAGGGLVTSVTGGVYATTGDGFQFVTEGLLLAADADRALVETCDEGLRCTRRWLDRESWQPLDLAVPARDDAVVLVLPGTDWVSVTGSRSSDTAELLNIETGQIVAMNAADPEPRFVGPPAVSPDGEWLAEPGADFHSVVLRNLTTSETKQVPITGAVMAGPLIFIAEQ